MQISLPRSGLEITIRELMLCVFAYVNSKNGQNEKKI